MALVRVSDMFRMYGLVCKHNAKESPFHRVASMAIHCVRLVNEGLSLAAFIATKEGNNYEDGPRL